MADRVIHISEAEAASDFAGLLALARAGAEVVIENGKLPVAVIHAPLPERRTIAECIARLPENSAATIDADFDRDVKAAVNGRMPRVPLPLRDVGESPQPSRAHRSEFYNPHDSQCSKPENL